MEERKIPQLLNLNIELTTNCPLRCPQCYCSLTGGKNIDFDVAISRMKEAKKLGLQEVMLSGGETMCYPYLIELIQAATDMGVKTNIALSGYNFTDAAYHELVNAGVHGIFISINGSTEEINSQTRDGFHLAMSALELLKQKEFPNTTINWVMHSSNAEDFPNVLRMAEQYKVAKVTVMAVKPNSKMELNTVPSKDQMLMVRDIIREYRGNTKIRIESCFSPMLALVGETKFLGNLNTGRFRGCGAGKWNMSVSVDGLLSPCRHLEYYENFATAKEYWENSEVLKRLREMDQEPPAEPCGSCHFMKYCRHCAAINSKLEGKLYRGNKYCPLAENTI